MTTQDPNNVGWVSEPVTRGTSSLLYTCISTTIICTWSALHLSIPVESSPAGRMLFYKIVMFVLAIIAPEYFVACAVNEWWVAYNLSKTMTEILPGKRKWSHACSHLTIMGGVKLRLSTAPNAPETILSGVNLIRFVEQGWIRCEELSIAAVGDRSKANAFNKAVASIQIFWFFSQLLGRLVSTIVVSPLEWFALAYVICALFMYGFWWHKPFDVQTPLMIYPDPLLSAEQTLELKYALPRRLMKRSRLDSFLDMVDTTWGRQLTMRARYDRTWMIHAEEIAIDTTALAIFTVFFGSCHLFGWNYPFPTTLETDLWRSASILCVCIPLGVLLFASFLSIESNGFYRRLLWDILILLAVMYVLVRLFLLFEVFFALRSAPPEIYKAVPWAQYIPHI